MDRYIAGFFCFLFMISQREILHHINRFLSVFVNKQYNSMQIVILILNNKWVKKDLNPDMDHRKTQSIDIEPLEKLAPSVTQK